MIGFNNYPPQTQEDVVITEAGYEAFARALGWHNHEKLTGHGEAIGGVIAAAINADPSMADKDGIAKLQRFREVATPVSIYAAESLGFFRSYVTESMASTAMKEFGLMAKEQRV